MPDAPLSLYTEQVNQATETMTSTLPPINYTPWLPENREHDDLMDADAYDRRRWERDGWADARQDRQRY